MTNLLRWLQQHGVATSRSHREHPQRNHCREVKRANAYHYNVSILLFTLTPKTNFLKTCCNSQWLSVRISIQTLRKIFQGLPHQQVTYGTTTLHNFQAAKYITLCSQ